MLISGLVNRNAFVLGNLEEGGGVSSVVLWLANALWLLCRFRGDSCNLFA